MVARHKENAQLRYSPTAPLPPQYMQRRPATVDSTRPRQRLGCTSIDDLQVSYETMPRVEVLFYWSMLLTQSNTPRIFVSAHFGLLI
jgi:hypothetical protein